MNNLDYDLQTVQEVRDLARQAARAEEQLATFSAEQIDRILQNMVRVAEGNAVSLARMAVEETGFGKVEDKTLKNQFASTGVYNYCKDMKTVGIIREDPALRITEIAEPVGVLMGIIPMTNPTSTIIYKAIIAIKARNAIVFSPHPSAIKCSIEAAKLMSEAAETAGAPPNTIGCITHPSIEATNELMRSDEVKMIIATGGSGMVKAAYSVGKPALGVGPGNCPAYIERSADIKKSVEQIMVSKTFDYSTICATEQSVIVEECNRDQVMEEFKRLGGYFMTKEETDKVAKVLFKPGGHSMAAKFVGRSAQVIADGAGITIPAGTKVLLGEQQGVGAGNPLSYEKLTSVLAFYTVHDWSEACELCIRLLRNGGLGHSLSLHTEDPEMVRKFSAKPVFRILVNSPSAQGATGICTGLPPSLTLGCGTWGGSATSDNVSPLHLINVKRVAYGLREVVPTTPLQAPVGSSSTGSNNAVGNDAVASVLNEVRQLLQQKATAQPQVTTNNTSSTSSNNTAGDDPIAGVMEEVRQLLTQNTTTQPQAPSNIANSGNAAGADPVASVVDEVLKVLRQKGEI